MPVYVDLPSAADPERAIRVDAEAIRRVEVHPFVPDEQQPACGVYSAGGSGVVRGTPDEIWTRIEDALAEAEGEADMAVRALLAELPAATINRGTPGTVVAILGNRGARLVWPGGSNPPSLVASFLRTGEPTPEGRFWDAPTRRP